MVDKIKEEILGLFNSDLTDYRIAKDSGVNLSSVQRYRKNKLDISNMTLKVADMLYKYAVKVKEDK